MTKFTFRIDPAFAHNAVSVAQRFLRDYAPRPRQRDCVITVLHPVNDESITLATFATWGDEKHVRVYQSEG
jgi:hypothetical protein